MSKNFSAPKGWLVASILLSTIISLGCQTSQAGSYRHSEIQAAINALSSTDSDTRRHAAMDLGDMGSQAKEAVPALIVTLGDPDPGIKDEVATALGKMGPNAKAAVPALVAFLQDHSITLVRSKAVSALADIGPAALPALPAIIDALANDPEVHVRACSARALLDLGEIARPGIPELIKCLSTNDAFLRQNATAAILQVGLDAKDVPLLLPYLSDEIDSIRSCSARALGAVGPTASAAIPALKKLTDDPSELVRIDAITALNQIDPKLAIKEPAKSADVPSDYGHETVWAWQNVWDRLAHK